MSKQTIPSFHVIGITVRTTNEKGQAMEDIPALWNRFMTDNIAAQIPGKVGPSVYCIYTDYEKDHTKPYTTLIGCRVVNLENIPAGMTGKTFEEGTYISFTAKGNLADGIVYNEWTKIWASSLDRSFTADFEVYGEKAADPEQAEVDIFVAVK